MASAAAQAATSTEALAAQEVGFLLGIQVNVNFTELR